MFVPTRTLLNFNDIPWVPVAESFKKRGASGRFERKSLTAPDGKTVGLVHGEGEAMPHFHTKTSSFFILSGVMELRDQIAGPGTWGLETYGAIHPSTKFRDVTYGLGMADGDFGLGNVIIQTPDDVPGWALDAGFKQDNYDHLADLTRATWLPFGDGLSIKVIHVFEARGAFASLLKGEAGARIPARRYLGPTDMYVLKGRAHFDKQIATPGCWVHEPVGATEGEVFFEEETEILCNCYGSIIEFAPSGRVSRVIDGFALRDLSAVRTDGTPNISLRSKDDIERSIRQFLEISTVPPEYTARTAPL